MCVGYRTNAEFRPINRANRRVAVGLSLRKIFHIFCGYVPNDDIVYRSAEAQRMGSYSPRLYLVIYTVGVATYGFDAAPSTNSGETAEPRTVKTGASERSGASKSSPGLH